MADFRLDEETKKALIGLMPCIEGSTIPFTPEGIFPENIDKKFLPVFTQRAFNREERKEAQELIAESLNAPEGETAHDKIKRIQKWNARCFELARKSIIGWKQFFNPATGGEIPYKAETEGGSPDPDIYNGLYGDIKSELFNNAYKISSLAPKEKKGLKPSPESTSER